MFTNYYNFKIFLCVKILVFRSFYRKFILNKTLNLCFFIYKISMFIRLKTAMDLC